MPARVNLIRTALPAVIVAMAGPAIAVEDGPRQALFTRVFFFENASEESRE